ncbi:MAG: roadblock/LC7 domain-containing protein [Candidatus Thermoplasmatota archaeon]
MLSVVLKELFVTKYIVIDMSGSTIEDILEEGKKKPEIDNLTLVSRTGMHIAGDAPKEAHQETYVAMSAILLGSSETATSELEDNLKYVLVELTKTRILIQECGDSAILVAKLRPSSDIDKVLEATEKAGKELEKIL